MTKAKLNRIGYISAALTFLIASFILIGYYFGWDGEFERNGILFIPIAALLNLCVIGYILFAAGKYGIEGPFRSIYAMLLNIPFAAFCLTFAIYLMSYYRVTIVNNTSNQITAIELSGCGAHTINTLKPDEQETVWIKISNDCSLTISYATSDGTRKEDVVAGYLTSGMGQAEDYHLSGRSNPRY